jgi:putative SOS response-associated peptidase YedK
MRGVCGRYSQTLKRDDLAGIFPQVGSISGHDDLFERFNIAPTDDVLTTVTTKEGEVRMGPLRWGLVPFWAKDLKIGAKMINARAETLTEKAAFRDLVQNGRSRCLIVADGYYEWLKPEDPKGPKLPMRMTLPDGAPFAFAGLWTYWRPKDEPDAERIATCTIITTAANATVRPVHDRMPVILPDAEAQATWLDRALDYDGVRELLAPLPDDLIAVHRANPLVNSVKNEGPELLVAPPA